jgi:hypothetical protein
MTSDHISATTFVMWRKERLLNVSELPTSTLFQSFLSLSLSRFLHLFLISLRFCIFIRCPFVCLVDGAQFI